MCNHDDVGSMWDDLDEEFDKVQPKAEAAPKFFPCISCSGTGVWHGRFKSGDCFACKGTGKRKATAAEQRTRSTAARKAKVTRANNIADGQAAIREHDGELLTWLSKNSHWNSFARSLMEDFNSKGKWTDKQVAAAKAMMAKVEIQRDEKRKENQKDVGDVSKIREIFDHAKEKGLNKRAILAGGERGVIKLTPAKEPRREIWVKLDDEFMGGIKDGKFSPRHECPDWVAPLLQKIAADPEREARLFGQRTGKCCFCRRELTNQESIDLGMGPICREKWLGL